MDIVSNQNTNTQVIELQKYCSMIEKENAARNQESRILNRYIQQLLGQITELQKNIFREKEKLFHQIETNRKNQRQLEVLKNERSSEQKKLLSIITQILLSKNANNPEKNHYQPFRIERKNQNQKRKESQNEVFEISFKQGLKKFKQDIEERSMKKFENIALRIRQELTKEIVAGNKLIKTLQEELESEIQKIIFFEQKLIDAEEENEKMKENLKTAEKENSDLKEKLKRNRQQLLILKNKQVEYEKHLSLKKLGQTQLVTVEEELSRAQFKINAQLQKNSLLTNAYSSQKTENSNLKKQIHELNIYFQNQIKERDKVIQKLKPEHQQKSFDSERSIAAMEVQEFFKYLRQNLKQFEEIEKQKQEYRTKVMILEESNKFLRENVVKNLDSILPKKNREREDDLSFVLEVKKKQKKFQLTKSRTRTGTSSERQ